MIEEEKYFPINIWDDFYDDGYVPEGEKLETYIYVEDSSVSHEKIKQCLELLLDYINQKLKHRRAEALDGVLRTKKEISQFNWKLRGRKNIFFW